MTGVDYVGGLYWLLLCFYDNVSAGNALKGGRIYSDAVSVHRGGTHVEKLSSQQWEHVKEAILIVAGHEQTGRQEVGVGVTFTGSRLPISLSDSHFLKIPQLFKIASSAGEQFFNT